jgi:hypothetical protein
MVNVRVNPQGGEISPPSYTKSVVYIFGLQRSGTNLLKQTLLDNFDVEVLNKSGTWWHLVSPPYRFIESGKVLIIYKNPYKWIESIVYRNRADTITTNINTYDLQAPDGYMIKDINLQRICRLYTDHVMNWNDPKFVKIQYESLLDDQTRDKALLGIGLGKPKQDIIVMPQPGSLFMSKEFNPNSVKYYLSNNVGLLNEDEIKIVNAEIPDRVFDILGYKKILNK